MLACDLVANEQGKLLLSNLETLTVKNFAASDDPTGNPQAGDWVLESDNVDVAPIYFNQAALDSYTGLLPGGPTAETIKLEGVDSTYTYTENDGEKVIDALAPVITLENEDGKDIEWAKVSIVDWADTGNYGRVALKADFLITDR